MQSLIAWFLRFKGFGSKAAGIIAAIVAVLVDGLKAEDKHSEKDNPRSEDRGLHPADDNHDFPYQDQ